MDKAMITCKESTLLIEKKHSEEIEEMDQEQLSLHLKNCKVCNLYARQAAIIERLLKTKPEYPPEEIENLKQKIQKKLKKK